MTGCKAGRGRRVVRLLACTLPLDEMTQEEKVQAMEAIWENLSRHPDDVPSPAWHGEVLHERQRRLDAGETHPVSRDEAQKEIDRLVALGSQSDAAPARS